MRPEVLVVTISLATGLDFEDMFDLAPVSLWMEDYSDLKQLFDLAQQDIMAMVREAMRMGLHQPKFPPKAA